ncbi:hypothetical protein N658DRAFT_179375 [Parathielavia hyrcaniae]|uniref:Phospholipid metabolism enzyme regulator n=1 Tax=Parathielavia hyrcaniae TaxID=113614 RepID=A0AAN6Q6H6_9PEZI|nr:hypothetical protein N658DRAFT_179375 [Parathielavia hyrcaniae]
MDKSPNIPTSSSEAPNGGRSAHPTFSRESSASTATITPMTESGSSRLMSQTFAPSASSSTAPSPVPSSREPSPTRPLSRTATSRTSSASSGLRSRKNSQQDLSPSRPGRQANPAPAPISKTLSSANTPTLLPSASDPSSNVGAPVKSPTTMEHLRESPRWPVSLRLRSPPPILNKPNMGLPRRAEPETPLINVQRATPPVGEAADLPSETDPEDAQLLTGMKTPARGGGGSTSTLETVQEVSPIGSPGQEDSIIETLDGSFTSETSQPDAVGLGLSNNAAGRTSADVSDGEADNVAAGQRSGSVSAPPLTTRQSNTLLKQGVTKTKTGEPSLQSMTVETETVTSIPQAPLVTGTGAQGSSVSLRTKPSTETIRPKKEKKRPLRKQPTVTAGNASSKADIFEAKVASAVEEANSSDSEETFVYDSNPPDGRERPMRFHSRTPSATSMASQFDRGGLRSIHTVMDSTGPPPVMKKNMKFVNSSNPNGNSDSGYVEDDGRGTARSNAGSTRGTARHHHHFGRWGRNGGGNGHPSLFAEHSPFSASVAAGNIGSRQSSGPPSPRFANRAAPGANGKRGAHLAAGYDLDDTTGADDERTPLIPSGTVRSGRSGRSRRGMHSLRSIEAQTYHRARPSVLNRFASCLVLTVMLLLVVSGAIGFMFATSQPLTDIELVSMEHIVASEQELMLDLTVRAHNPNVVVVVVDSADIEVFAKSPHAMTDSEWWRYTHPGEIGPPPPRRVHGGKDNDKEMKIMDADPDPLPPDDSSPNMRLGTITGFDSALSFEGSFFHKGISYSTGEVRLKNPGNGTYGGPQRWERIMEDEFQLILKGVLRYTLPLSQRVRTATVSGKATVKPNAANDPPGLKPNSTVETGPSKGGEGEVSISFAVG